MPRLGVIGTMVWDRIYGPNAGPHDGVEAWGGIAYSLAAADASLGSDWSLFPLIKVGTDLRSEAEGFLSTLASVDSKEGLRSVPEPNNRVDLYYHEDDPERRCEKLSGGVPAWTASELIPLAASCDAVYINFIAGWEFDLEIAKALRESVAGPMYADLHSLMLGIGEDGIRRLQPLADWRAWVDNFDYVQLNEDELETMGDAHQAPTSTMADILAMRTKAVFVTLGERGVQWMEAANPDEKPRSGSLTPASAVTGADPTGCGDVWGATCFASLLDGCDLESAARTATDMAQRNARYQGATGLRDFLVTGVAS